MLKDMDRVIEGLLKDYFQSDKGARDIITKALNRGYSEGFEVGFDRGESTGYISGLKVSYRHHDIFDDILRCKHCNTELDEFKDNNSEVVIENKRYNSICDCGGNIMLDYDGYFRCANCNIVIKK